MSSGKVYFAENYGALDTVVTDIAGVNAVTVDSTGVYLGGRFQGDSIKFGDTVLKSIGNKPNAFVVKTSKSGTVEWAKNYGAGGGDTGIKAITVDSTGVYLGGDFQGDKITFGDTVLKSIGDGKNSFLVKTSKSGTVEWAKNYGAGGGDTDIKAITVDSTGVYLGGNFQGDKITFGDTVLKSIGDEPNAFVVKTSKSGTVEWAKNYGVDEGVGTFAGIKAIAVDSNGVCLGGEFFGEKITFGDTVLKRFGDGLNIFVVKTSKSGTVEWAKNYGASGEVNPFVVIFGITVDSTGVYFGGSFAGDKITFGDTVLKRIGKGLNYNAFVVKTSKSGKVEWAKNYGADTGVGPFAELKAITVDSTGVYLGGLFQGDKIKFGDTVLKMIGDGQNSFLVKTSKSGTVEWAKNYGASGEVNPFVVIFGITVDSAGVYLGGSFQGDKITFGDTVLKSIGNGTNAFVVKNSH